MPELAEVEVPTTSGFVNPAYNNRNRKRIEEEEKELAELEGSQEEEVTEKKEADTEVEEEALSREEKSFKKRYGDLRRHLNEKEKEMERTV